VVAPLRELGQPLADLSGPVPYVQAQTFFDEEYPATRCTTTGKSLHVPALGDEVIDLIVDHAAAPAVPAQHDGHLAYRRGSAAIR